MPATAKSGSLGVTLSGGTMINVPAPHEGPEWSGVPGFSAQSLFEVTAGVLPPGLSIAQKAVGTGTTNQFGWKGTPTALGVYTATIGPSGTFPGGDYEWTISLLGGCPLVSIDPPSPLDDLLQGMATAVVFTASNGVAPYIFDFVGLPGEALPDGMSLSLEGVLSGTPTTPDDLTFTIRATDDNGCAGIRTYTLTVRGVRIDVATGSPPVPVDHTADVLQADFELGLNQRSTARLVFGPGFIPDRGAEVILYGRDGITPIFGGIILRRNVRGMAPSVEESVTDADCVDFAVYFDHASVTLTYDDEVAVEDVINDVADQVLADYGLSYTPVATGLTMQPFSWVDVVVTTAFKQISDKTGIVFRVTPQKAIQVFVPGTDPAPIAIADANINAFDLAWKDNERLTANVVELYCGPSSGPGLMGQRWVADGVETSWVTDLPAIDPPPILVEVDDGVTPYLATVVPAGGGSPSAGMFEWDRDTHTLSLGTDPVPAAGTTITLGRNLNFPDSPFTYYTVQFPFKVTVPSSPPTPRITYRESRPDCVESEAALEIANGLLVREGTPRRDLEVHTDVDGFFPGQALAVDTTDRGGLVGEFLVALVRGHLITGEIWEYTVVTQEASPTSPTSPTYRGSYVDEWKALTGGPSAASATVTAPVAGSSNQSVNFEAATVATAETQAASTAYADLATAGPSVTIEMTGTVAIVILSCKAERGGAGNSAFMGVAVSGASTVAASDAQATSSASFQSGIDNVMARVIRITGLTPGSNTFTAKYHNDGGSTWTFRNRSMAVYAP